MRRATLRGLQNLQKRYKLAAAFYNLSQLMRKLFGVGTPKQYAALAAGSLTGLLKRLLRGLFALLDMLMKTEERAEQHYPHCPSAQ